MTHPAPPFRRFDQVPGISVLVPTYGRTRLLPEIMESFARQDYERKEMVILNDHPRQTLVYDGPESIRIINRSMRYATLGDKRNALLAEALHPIVTYWDDDDIYLPYRLANGISLWRQGYRASIEGRMWVDVGEDHLLYSDPVSPMAGMLVEMRAAVEVGGFPAQQSCADVEMVRALCARFWVYAEEYADSPTTIYRTTGDHMRVTKPDFSREPDPAVLARVTTAVEADIAAGKEPTGLVRLVPKWDRDYSAWAAESWAALHP